MNQTKRSACFGTMFPEARRQGEAPQRGKVFSIQSERTGGLWRGPREIAADMNQWDACQACPAFDGCYKFSIAKLLLANSLAAE